MTNMESVNHPAYYQGQNECIEVMKALFGAEAVKDFCRCNSFKYRFRAGKKDGVSAAEDLAKASWYEDYLMQIIFPERYCYGATLNGEEKIYSGEEE